MGICESATEKKRRAKTQSEININNVINYNDNNVN